MNRMIFINENKKENELAPLTSKRASTSSEVISTHINLNYNGESVIVLPKIKIEISS